MRILFVNRQDALENMGGDTIQMLKTKESLEKMGYEVDIRLGNVEQNYYSNFDIIHIFNIQTDKFTLKEAKKIKKINKPLIISPIWWDFEEYMVKLDINNNFLIKFIPYKLIKFLKNKKLQIRYMRMNKILNISDYILPNSIMEIESLIRSFNVSKNKCKAIYNGVSSEFISKSEDLDIFESDRSFALQVGRIEEVKNQIFTIQACNELKIPLIIVGKNKDQNYYDKCVNEAKYGDVKIIDAIEQSQLIDLYKKAKIHILPSYRETPGLVSLEAAVCGCNIVSTEIGSAKEYFKDMVSYCIPNDYMSVKKAISNEWKKDINSDLRNHIINNFTWDIAAIETAKIYEKVVKRK